MDRSIMMSDKKSQNKRILSIDVLRGLTVAGMILVNNPGGGEVFTPFEHANWIGLTPADLVFPMVKGMWQENSKARIFFVANRTDHRLVGYVVRSIL